MAISLSNIKALCFDFGNTLIEYGQAQVAYQYEKLVDILTELFGRCDPEHLKAIRDRQIIAPFNNGYRENDLRSICEELIRELYGIIPEKTHVDTLMEARYRAFVDVAALPDGVLMLLQKFSRRYQLGLLSNYPCGRSIRDSLKKIGLSDLFDAIVVSGEVGYAKPHTKPFETLLHNLRLSPSECVYVGDNWLADVQGAKRIGMTAILTTQYAPYETITPSEGDFVPDICIDRLEKLDNLLMSGSSI
jgi:HAD superfamily hydrolase (TIGR01509 family)